VRLVTLLLGALVLCTTFADAALAQKKKAAPTDPSECQYCKGDPERMKAGGIVSHGPFPFAKKDSASVDALLPTSEVRWIETDFFRIGFGLREYKVKVEEKKKMVAELTRLKQFFPEVKPDTGVLDPWLRTHLFAQRAQDSLDDFLKLINGKEAAFGAGAVGNYRGEGRYLGMKEKYLVFVTEKAGPFQEYMKTYVLRDSALPQRWHYKDSGSLLICFCTESDKFPLKHDTALHCALAFNVGINLLDGFRFYAYNLPVWIREGFGHWNSRRVSGDWSSFDQNEGSTADMKVVGKWDVYCRNLLGSPKLTPFPEVVAWRDFGNIKFDDHVGVWSRIDWMIAQGPEKWQKFLFAVKGRVDENWSPDQSDLVGATRTALQAAYGVSTLDFDRKWAEWVKATYPAQ